MKLTLDTLAELVIWLPHTRLVRGSNPTGGKNCQLYNIIILVSLPRPSPRLALQRVAQNHNSPVCGARTLLTARSTPAASARPRWVARTLRAIRCCVDRDGPVAEEPDRRRRTRPPRTFHGTAEGGATTAGPGGAAGPGGTKMNHNQWTAGRPAVRKK